ncbi:hypothetical protein [Nonomuraea sp. NPDC050783]|uniref:hypothetical protein n=1 Tax=Nonomuraea sp. NPDC050783 TaxID=3154634 RepID=UPI00346657D5
MSRCKILTIATILAVAGVLTGAATPASADPLALVACPGYVEQTIDPGLTVLPATNTVKVSGTFGPCVNQIIDPDHAFAEYSATATGLISCTVNAPITNATGTVKWENAAGQHTGTSSFSGGITISQRPVGETVGIVLATITSGDFAGSTLQLTSARLTVDPVVCLTSGVRRVAGPGSLEVLPL